MSEQNKKKTANNQINDPMIGITLAERYKIISIIGRGGMGVVYEAEHLSMGRSVAIKMLLPQLAGDEISIKRFEREAKAVSLLSHPHIVGLHDFGIEPYPYLVMDYARGINLSSLLKKEKQIGVSRARHIFVQICDALAYAHANGLVHRDLKSSNIMLCEVDDDVDFVKIVDFGLAKAVFTHNEDLQMVTHTGEIFGSPVYMSPEQCARKALDARTDIYSLGIVMYETITGKVPFLGDNVIATITAHLSEPPKLFSKVRSDLYIPERFEAVIHKALEKDPKDRQQSMAELKEELLQSFNKNSTSISTKAVQNTKDEVKAFPSLLWFILISLLILTIAMTTCLFQLINERKSNQSLENGNLNYVKINNDIKSAVNVEKNASVTPLVDTGNQVSKVIKTSPKLPVKTKIPVKSYVNIKKNLPQAKIDNHQENDTHALDVPKSNKPKYNDPYGYYHNTWHSGGNSIKSPAWTPIVPGSSHADILNRIEK
jgi:serine/threonine protein kinase